MKSLKTQINLGANSVIKVSLSTPELHAIEVDKCAASDNSEIPNSSIFAVVLYMNKELIKTTSANILLSYVFVLLSILEVPSESINIIFAPPPCLFRKLPHNQIPFVQDEIVESTSN